MSSMAAATLFSVRDMVFVITGGGSGLGAMMATALAENGAAKVFILGRREASLRKVAAQAKSGAIIPVVCDTTSKESLDAAVKEVERQTPFVNAVVANSGALGAVTGFSPRPTVAELQKLLWSQSTQTELSALEVNVLGSYYTCVAFLGLLDAGNKHPASPGRHGYVQSQFIATTSMAAYVRSETVGYAYSASKAALTHTVKMLATELAGFGIRANAFSPGLFLTEMTEPLLPEVDFRVPGSTPKEENPATRCGTDEDAAGAILFLASRAGGFVNGNVIMADGGVSSVRPATY